VSAVAARVRALALSATCAGALLAGVSAPARAQTTATPAVTTTAPGATTVSPAATTPEVTAADAGPGAVVDAADRVEIASSLADATEQTGVCFGYLLTLSDDTGAASAERVSNAGPGRSPTADACRKGVVEARISLVYTAESSEAEDSASVLVESSVPGLPSSVVRRRLDDLGVLDEGAFLGDEDDLAVRNLAVALPLTLDAAVPTQETTTAAAAAPNGDRLSGSPGSDWVRAHLVTVLASAAVLAIALVVAVGGWLGRRATGPRRPKPGDPTPSSSSDSPSA
jgi:hypothetical protein